MKRKIKVAAANSFDLFGGCAVVSGIYTVTGQLIAPIIGFLVGITITVLYNHFHHS